LSADAASRVARICAASHEQGSDSEPNTSMFGLSLPFLVSSMPVLVSSSRSMADQPSIEIV
jgi:hypothetical protein